MVEIKRMCVICGKELEIIVHPDKSYEGGHFFFTKDEECPENEYWECDDCYEKD